MISKIIPVVGFGITASQLEARLISDDLKTSATFYWALITDSGKTCLEGNVSVSGEEYTAWRGDNPTAIELCAKEAGVTLIEEGDSTVEIKNTVEEVVVTTQTIDEAAAKTVETVETGADTAQETVKENSQEETPTM